MLSATPMIVRIIPPANSHLQAMMSITTSTNDGTRCISNAAMFCQKVLSGENESSANMLTRRIDRIQIILGAQ